MPRLLVTLVAVFAILCSGVSSAWASARMIPAATSPAAAHSHCQHDAASAPATAGDCCKNCASCGDACSAPAALTPATPELTDYISAHFDAARATAELFPAHALSRLRPPITPSS